MSRVGQPGQGSRPRRRALGRLLSLSMLLGAVASVGAQSARAQDYPSRPLKLVLGFPPGGSTDLSARRVADQLAKRLGQSVVVENRPGASGNIAADYVAKSPADGYTMFYGTNTTHAMNVSLYPKLPFDPIKDFTPVILQGKVYNVLSVTPDFQAKTYGELIGLARVRPDFYHYATPGNSTSPHLSFELVKLLTGVRITQVPYKGSLPAITDVIGGQVPVLMDNLPASLPYIRSGKLRALAVTSPKRLSLLPDVPTFDELGLSGFEVSGWGGVLVPAGTPTAIVDRLNRELNAVLKSDEVRGMMLETGSEPQGGSSQDFVRHIAAETARWRDVINKAGIKLD